MLNVPLHQIRRIGLILASVIVAHSAAPADPCPREVGRWPYGAAVALTADDDIIFSNSGCVLQIVRFTPPDTLEPLSETRLADAPWQLVVTGNHVVAVLGDHGMQFIDVSNLEEPRVVGSHPVDDFAVGVAVEDNVAWVAAGYSGVRSFDISDPTDPRPLGALVSDLWTNGLTIADGILWAATRFGFRAIDIADPTQPNTVGTYHPVYFTGEGEYVYYPGGRAMAANRDRLFLAAGSHGVAVVDYTDPTEAVQVAGLEAPGRPIAIESFGDHLLLSSEGDSEGVLRIIDVGDPEMPTLAGHAGDPSFRAFDGIIAFGNHAFALSGLHGTLQVFDLQDPADPRPGTIVEFDTGFYAAEAELHGDFLLLAAGAGGVLAVYVSDPSSPVEFKRFLENSRITALALSGETLFVENHDRGLGAIDISDFTYWRSLGIRSDVYAWDIEVRDHIVFITSDYGLQVFDYTDPRNSIELARLALLGWVRSEIELIGNYAVVIKKGPERECWHNAHIIDISNPANPVHKGSTCTVEPRIVPHGDLLALADRYGGLRILDLDGCAAPSPRDPGILPPSVE